MRYLDFVLDEPHPRRTTHLVHVVRITSRERLGEISWYGSWRQYVFVPDSNTIWSAGCLDEVQRYVTKMQTDWRLTQATKAYQKLVDAQAAKAAKEMSHDG